MDVDKNMDQCMKKSYFNRGSVNGLVFNRLFLILMIISAFLISGCSAKTDEGGAVDVRIAYFPNVTHTQALVMKEQGMLEEKWKDKCNVSWIAFNAGPAEIEAMFAGEIDLGYIGPVPAINAYVKSKGDVSIIANAVNAGAVLVKSKDSDIKAPKDLDGKTVAIPQLGNTQHLTLLYLLSQNGLKSTSAGGTVEIAAVSNADVMNMMEQGNIEAALVPEPWGSILEKQVGAKVVMDYDQMFLKGKYPTAVVIASRDFMDAHEDIVTGFLQAHEEATLYINENKTEIIPQVNNQIKEATGKSIDEDILKSALERIDVTTAISKEAMELFSRISYNEGFVTQMPDDKLLDEALLQQ